MASITLHIIREGPDSLSLEGMVHVHEDDDCCMVSLLQDINDDIQDLLSTKYARGVLPQEHTRRAVLH